METPDGSENADIRLARPRDAGETRDSRASGLLTYGIPGFKLEKDVVMRRIGQLEAAGVKIVHGCDVGHGISYQLRGPPFGIALLDQFQLPLARPFLQRFLALNGELWLVEAFTMNEVVYRIPLGEAFHDAIPVLPHAPGQTIRYPYV